MENKLLSHLPRIEAIGLSKTYHLPRGKVVRAVLNATFNVAAGEIYGLLGPNGAGKTTLLRMLGTIIAPSAGLCRIAGMDTRTAPEEARRRTGFLSGNTRLYARLTPREVLLYFGRLHSVPDAQIVKRTAELAEALDMTSFMDRRCEALSTGQTQKVSIARVLLHDPPVLILDEPTLGLDIMTSRTILDFIRTAKTLGRCIIFSTHYMTEAEALCDRIGLIHEGAIFAEGSIADLYHQAQATNLSDAFLHLVDQRMAANAGNTL